MKAGRSERRLAAEAKLFVLLATLFDVAVNSGAMTRARMLISKETRQPFHAIAHDGHHSKYNGETASL